MQKYLLLNFPLLWNTKFIPIVIFCLIVNCIFFSIGYFPDYYESIFSDKYFSFREKNSLMSIAAILCTILGTIVWLIFYLKNNPLKSLYPVKTYKLFTEWILILIIALLNVSYFISYDAGKYCKIRTYMAKEEVTEALNVIGKGKELFITEYDYDIYNKHNDNQEIKNIFLDSIETDEINKRIKNIFILINKYKFKSNITEEECIDLVLEYKKGDLKTENFITTNSNSYENNIIKNYIPLSNMRMSFYHIEEAYSNDYKYIIALFYLALAASVFIFSFRVTPLRTWLFSVVSIIVISILFFLFMVLFKEYIYYDFNGNILASAYWMVCFLLFIMIAIFAGKKGLNAIFLNMSIWISAFFGVALFYLVYYLFKIKYEKINILGEDEYLAFSFNFIIALILMVFMCKIVKRWNSLPKG